MKRVDYLAYLLIFIAVIYFSILYGCATMEKVGISLKAPTAQALTKGFAYEAGFIIGEEEPALAKEFLEYTQVDRKDLDTFYPSWKRYLSSKLTDKPRYQRLIRLALSAVDIRLEFKRTDEQNKIIRELFREFIAGLQAGIDANPDR